MSTHIKINDLDIDHGDEYGPSIAWRTSDVDLPKVEGGEDDGRLLVRLSVDGTFDAVYGDLMRTGMVPALRRSVSVLSDLLAHVEGLAGAGILNPGQCLDHDGYGRCRREHGHDGEHTFPSEIEMRREIGQLPPKASA